jgi:diguanylate cyclase (GGDEF)-like protein
MLGQSNAAIAELEPILSEITGGALGELPPVRMGISDEVLVRIGLARAHALADRPRASAEAVRAREAAERVGDPKLVLAASWEGVRLAAREPISAGRAIVADYTDRLEAERWQERVRFTRETRDRLQAQRERIRARRMSAEYLTDGATGVPNRRHLELRLPEFVDRARSHQESVALAFVDLDSEPSLDTLVAVGAMLRERAAPDGFVARYGGTEFVVIVPRRTAKQLAALVAEVLQERPRSEPGPRPRVGVVSMTDPPSITGLFAAADEALLAARRAGGGIRLAAASDGLPPASPR